MIAPPFSHDQRVAEVIDMLNGSYRLTCADALVAVFKGKVESFFVGLLIAIAKYSNTFRSGSPQMSGDPI